MKILATVIILLALAALAGGLWPGEWAESVPAQQPSLLLEQPLTTGVTLGQTFRSAYAGLQEVGVRVSLPAVTDQPVTLRLYAAPGAQTVLRQAVTSPTTRLEGGVLAFQFEPLAASQGQDYYVTLESNAATPETALSLYAGPLTGYVNGSTYLNHSPIDYQLDFYLSYHRPTVLLNLGQRVLEGLPSLFIMAIFLLVPGGFIWVWWMPRYELDPIELIAMITGVSLSLYPLMIYGLSYTPVSLNPVLVWAILAVLGLGLAVKLWQRGRVASFKVRPAVDGWLKEPAVSAFGLVFFLSALVRWMVIDGVEVPLWGDSYHHTMLSQLIVTNGKLPLNWEPYVPSQGINYHYGFHAMAAFFHWLTGIPVVKSVLYLGQVLNALAVLMAYLMGRRFGGNAWVGVVAALLTGLIFRFPMYYVNWGRYTQLAGQVILPVLMVASWLLLTQPQRSWRLIGLNAGLLTALFLTHYRVVTFYPCFIAPLVLIRWYQAKWSYATLAEDLKRLAGVGIGAAILSLPHLYELLGSKVWAVQVAVGQAGMNNDYVRETQNAPWQLENFLPYSVLVLAWAGLAWGVWRQKAGIAALGGMWGLMLLITNPHWLGLPGAGMITNFAIYIGAYLIFAVLAGFAVGEAIRGVTRFRPESGWAILAVILGLALWEATQQAKLLDPTGMLVTPPDLRAMVWIKTHTPEEATFLVNSELAYGGGVVAGTDAGWWIPLLTGRQNTAPPMVYVTAAYRQQNQEIYKAVHEPGLALPELAKRMLARNLTYIYLGQQRGRVWQGDETPPDPAWFANTPLFELVYAQDGVRIFRLEATQVK